MDRRAVLRAAGGALAVGALGGCLGGGDGSGSGSTDRTTAEGSGTVGGSEPSSTDSDGGTTAPADRDCAVDGVTVSQPGAEYVVVVDDDTAQGHPVTLTNETVCELRIDTAAWRLARETSSGWSTVETGQDGERRRLEPGDTHDWSLSVEPHPTPGPVAEETTFVFFEGAPEGRYAFAVEGTLVGPEVGTAFTRPVEFTLRKERGSTTTGD